jgi:N-acetylmuramoyl-L-alanine amidase
MKATSFHRFLPSFHSAAVTAMLCLPAHTQDPAFPPPEPPQWSLLEDADQDGLTDWDEFLLDLDPLDPADGLSDDDGDGLSLAWEWQLGTHPDVADSDGDGWSDSEEVLLYGTDPLDPASRPLRNASADPEDPMASTSEPSTPPVDEPPPPPPPPSLSNGDFTEIGIQKWKELYSGTSYQGGGFRWGAGPVTAWTAYVGQTIEVWQAKGETFVELDGDTANYGIKQPIANVRAGAYILTWKQCGRNHSKAGENPYYVRIYHEDSTESISKSDTISGFDKMNWTDNAHAFQITPEHITAAQGKPIYVAFIPTSINTYGTLIDKVGLLPVEVVELSPKTKDEDGNEIAGSEKPNSGKPLTPFVEVDPVTERIAHRELKVRIGEPLKGKTVTWTMEPLFRRTAGPYPFEFRGKWTTAAASHRNRFEASTAYGANGFTSLSQESGRTTVADDGFTAIRVNVPPVGFNASRIKIQIEGIKSLIDLIDMEVPGVVVIDPGHGGKDSGAVGRTDSTILEKDLALEYSLSLKQKVTDKFGAEKHNLKLYMTRKTTDEYMENSARAILARDKGADVLLSIHFNSADSTTARGTEYVTRSSGQVNAEEDDQLGVSVQSSTLAAVKAFDTEGKHRDPKSGEFAVISDTHYGNTADYHPIRGVIIEVEFLSHETALESVKLSNATGQAIRTKFAADVSNDIYNDILNQP